jgi:hypothetical protein
MRKHFTCADGQISGSSSRVLCLTRRGVSRSSRTFGAGCDGRGWRRQTSGAIGGRRSRVVLTPRRWRQVLKELTLLRDDGDNKPGSPGRARRKPLKPFVQGVPDRFGVPVVTTLVCSFCFACEAAGASSARHSLHPPISEGKTSGKTRALCVARPWCRVLMRRLSSSSPRMRGPKRRGFSVSSDANGFLAVTSAGGYGFLRSQERRKGHQPVAASPRAGRHWAVRQAV